MATAETIQARIAVAKRIKTDRDAEYDRWLRLLTNDWSEGTMKLAPNVVHSGIRQLVSTVLFSEPQFLLRAMQPRYSDASKGVTAYDQWLWGQIEGDEQTELVITDAIVYPIGFWKLGMGRAYNSEKQLKELTDAEDEARAEQEAWLAGDFGTPVSKDQRHATHIPMHQQFRETEEYKASEFKEIMDEVMDDHVDQHGEFLVVVEATTQATTEGLDPDKPFIYRVSPRNIFTDAGHMVFEQSRYVLERARMSYDEWKENPAYDHQDIQPTDISDEARDTFDEAELEMTRTERGMGVIDIWHHIDKASGEYSSWTDGNLTPVRKPQPQLYRFMKGYPYEALRIDIVPERLHGPGLVSRLEHPQQMDIDVSHRLGTHARNASNKWILIKDRLENSENADNVKREIQDSEMDAVIEANATDVLTAVPPAILDPIFAGIRGLLKENVQEALGLSDTGRGQITGATATEVNKVTASQGVNLGGISKKVKRALVNIIKKLNAITREYGPDHMVVPIFGTKEGWADFKRADLAGEYQVVVQLPLPGDKQNDLNNKINAVHEMGNSPHIRGEGEKRLHMDMLRAMDLEPALYDLDLSGDTRKSVILEHKQASMGQPIDPPLEDEDISYHIEQHNLYASDIERQLMQIQQIMQQVQQMQQQLMQQGQAQGIPAEQLQQQVQAQIPPEAQLAMQMGQSLQQQLQFVLEHIQMSEQIKPGIPQGRRRNALLFPSGNPGTAESVQANEIGAS